MIDITPICALHDNYIWMIVHPENKLAIVVDPGTAKPVLQALKKENLTLAAILITHHHWDHTNGIAELLHHRSVPVYGPANDSVPECDHPLREGDQVSIPSMGLEFRVLDIPGHTLGHIAYIGAGGVFCGDTLFTAGCGRLFEGTPAQMVDSLNKLAALPPETAIYCGHEYTEANLCFAEVVEPNNSDIKQRVEKAQALRRAGKPTVPAPLSLELATNPFLRCNLQNVIEAANAHSGNTLNDKVEVFSVIRSWKDHL